VQLGRLTTQLWNYLTKGLRSKSPLGNRGVLYEFEAPVLGFKRSVPAVVKSEIDWVVQFIPVSEFETLFGGYITWHPTDQIGETIGVWGKRNVSRFRRTLRERGAEFDVIDNEGPHQRPWVVTTHGYSKKGRRMLRRTQGLDSKTLRR